MKFEWRKIQNGFLWSLSGGKYKTCFLMELSGGKYKTCFDGV